jgi:DNA-binding MarR family transcriptional regulator
MADDSPWLSEDQQLLWRSWLRLNSLLPVVLHRELQADADISLSDFEVLVTLTDTPEGRVRVSDLARELNWERSRVSHHVTRMERRGLVERSECRDDGRGAWVVLTGHGRSAIERAAPGHARAVRRLIFDDLSPDELAVMSGVVDTVLARLLTETGRVPGC